MPPQERQHEGLGGWGIVSHARSLGTTQRGRGAVVVCFEGGCGSGNAKQSFAGRIPKRSLGTTETTEDEVFARHRGIIAQGSGLRAASGEDGTRGLVFRATCRLRRGRHEGGWFSGLMRIVRR